MPSLTDIFPVPEPPRAGPFRLTLTSQVVAGRPVHMLRCGTFTDSAGHAFTFEPRHIQSIVANYARRPNPPITERHDWGRAVGRVAQLWADEAGENLYGMPAWNRMGQELLAEGVYDGYSCELDDDGAGGFVKIGGSLTNYPAVSGLQQVQLAAPAIDPPAIPGAPDPEPLPEEIPPMADDPTVTLPPAADPPSPPAELSAEQVAAALASANLPAQFSADIGALVRQQVQAQLATVRAQAEQEARAEIARFQAAQRVAQFAQHVTTPTTDRAAALPVPTERIERFLLALSGDARKEAMDLFDAILDAGLVTFEEYGSQGDGGDGPSATQQYNEAVAYHVGKGMTRSAALSAVNRAQPDLMRAYNAEQATPKKGGR